MEAILTAKQVQRARRKAIVKARNEPPRLTVGEEAFNAASHGVGAALAIAGMILLLLRSDTGLEIMASCFYGISMVLMMLMSSVYHAMPACSTAKRVCRRFDYTSIYLLIGGTFAPILLLYVGGKLGIALISIFGPGRWRPLHFTLYFLIGWSGLVFLPSFYLHARTLLWFILMGGVVYTLGMIPFARNRKYDHCIWHVFVLVAAALHWAGIYTQLY